MRKSANHPRIRKRLEGTLRDKWDLLADHQAEDIRALERAIGELSRLTDLPGLGSLNVLSPKYQIALAELTKIDPARPPLRRLPRGHASMAGTTGIAADPSKKRHHGLR